MIIESKLERSTVVAILNGRMDAVTAPQFDAWFGERLQAGENRLVLDLTRLEYISSAGLRSLLSAARGIKAAAGAIMLCGLTGAVAEVIKISGFMTVFTVTATAEEALSAMG